MLGSVPMARTSRAVLAAGASVGASQVPLPAPAPGTIGAQTPGAPVPAGPGPIAVAQDTKGPAQGSPVATEQPRAKAGDSHCAAGEPVSIWYLNNPQASGGLYNNPWADCRPGTNRQ